MSIYNNHYLEHDEFIGEGGIETDGTGPWPTYKSHIDPDINSDLVYRDSSIFLSPVHGNTLYSNVFLDK